MKLKMVYRKELVGDVLLTIGGMIIILLVFIYSYGGFKDPVNITGYNIGNIHRYTARALLEGKFYLPVHFMKSGLFDRQFYNGAVFTNWGYGVPLLQLPFHWLANLIVNETGFHYFPDRLIFVLFFCFNLFFFYTAIIRLFKQKFRLKQRLMLHGLGIIIVLFLYTAGLFWLTSLTLYVYQETIAYFILMQFYTAGFFLHFFLSKKIKWLIPAALTAGMTILIRPTGLVYYFFWLLIFVFCHKNTFREWIKRACLFIMVSLPLIGFWCATNYYKSGQLITAGIENSQAYSLTEIDNLRFTPNNTPRYWPGNAARIFFAQFIGQTSIVPLKIQALFDYNEHPASVKFNHEPDPYSDSTRLLIETQGTYMVPFFGGFYLFFLAGTSVYFLIFHRKRFVYLTGVAAFSCMFFIHIYSSFTTSRFALRYCGDFWPALILVFLFTLMSFSLLKIRFHSHDRQLMLLLFLFFLLFYITNDFSNHISRQAASVQAMSAAEAPGYESNFFEKEFRQIPLTWNNLKGPDFSQYRQAADPLTDLKQDRLYWDHDGRVKSITNFFIGVKPKTGKNYQLILLTESAVKPVNRIYINGRKYLSKQENNKIVVDFMLDYQQLVTPNIQVTVKWGKDSTDYEAVRFLSACLL